MRQLRNGVAVVMTAALAVVTGSCSGILSEPLTPARSLAGTWTTQFTVPMNLQSDWCGAGRQTVAKQTWLATFIITERSQTSNGVDVEMRITQRGALSYPTTCSGASSSYVPEPSPLFMTGTISGTRLQFYNLSTNAAFDGDMITDNITGSFGLWKCYIYCAGEQSEVDKFILTRTK